MAVLEIVLDVLVIVGLPVFLWYWKERLKNVAREGTEKALADYKHEHDRLLAVINADHQRRLHEFNLFTQKQHVVYATLYRHARMASDGFASLLGLSSGPDFRGYTEEHVEQYRKDRELLPADVAPALEAYRKGDRTKAAELMDDLHFKANRRDARRAFARMKSIEALYQLYLSEGIQERMADVRMAIAQVSVAVDHEFDDDRRDRDPQAHEKSNKMEAAVSRLLWSLREEMRRGEGASKASTY